MFTWRIHTGLLGGRENELASLLGRLGDPVQFVSGHWRELPPPLPSDDAELGGMALTTIQDAQRLLTDLPYPRVLYFNAQRFDVSFWLPRIDDELPVLNRRCLFTPAGLIAHAGAPFSQAPFPPSNGLLFVRPDSALKPFPGFVIDCHQKRLKGWPAVSQAVEQETRGLAPEKLVCIAPGHRLKPLEWRFWVVNREVVASTPYSWEAGTVPWQAPPDEALRLARDMARNAWQPDVAYVVDIVQLDEGDEPFYLNELNAASTSGLYCVPFEPLFEALRHAVLLEIAGELSVED